MKVIAITHCRLRGFTDKSLSLRVDYCARKFIISLTSLIPWGVTSNKLLEHQVNFTMYIEGKHTHF